MSCIVVGCKSHSSRKENDAKIISFHRFPSDVDMRQKWINAIARNNWEWKKQHRICSKHFSDDCFNNIGHKWRRLKIAAVPSLHLRKEEFMSIEIHFHEESYLSLFPKDKIVYLTSESENIIEDFEDNTAYIIGGLVDHNQYKGLCHNIAVDQGIRHGQLPLNKYINMKTRKVLTIDHVFEIILRVCEGMPWQEVLLKVLPMRKGAHICDNVSSSNSSLDTLSNNVTN